MRFFGAELLPLTLARTRRPLTAATLQPHGGGVSGDCYHVPMNFVIVIVSPFSLSQLDPQGELTLLSTRFKGAVSRLYST
uniref:Putative secreted protein n=1 Tax=Anopheles marajoara TaxID=58244 RepID=A0A2M4CBR7_9DIPT